MDYTAKRTLRNFVRFAYDLQKIRTSIGNRVYAFFAARLGWDKQDASEEDKKKKDDYLDELEQEYRTVTDGLVKISKAVKWDERWVPEGYMRSYTDLIMVQQYVETYKQERSSMNKLSHLLEGWEIADWLLDIDGLGKQMAALIVAEIDPHKAKYPSSIWRFWGLDVLDVYHVVQGTKKNKQVAYTAAPNHSFTEDSPPNHFNNETVPDGCVVHEMKDGRYRLVETATGDSLGVYTKKREGRNTKKGHRMLRAYTDKNGNPAACFRASHNPWLKSKMVRVLADNFVKNNSYYKGIYDDYKTRLETDPKYKDVSKGYRHNMALRYITKEFGKDLYNAWRPIEGLPVHPPYHEAKHGHVHGQAA